MFSWPGRKESLAQSISAARAQELLPRARRREPPADRADARHRGRAASIRAGAAAPHQPTAHVLASAPPSARGDHPYGALRPRGALLLRSGAVRGARRARLPSAHEPRGSARAVSHGLVPGRVAEGTRLGIAPLARRLSALGVSANAVTVAGGALTVAGAGLVAARKPPRALGVLRLGALPRTLDRP